MYCTSARQVLSEGSGEAPAVDLTSRGAVFSPMEEIMAQEVKGLIGLMGLQEGITTPPKSMLLGSESLSM